MNIFEVATREKYRFSYKGSLTVEDLWDLSVDELDTLFKSLNARLRESKEESLLETKTKADKELEIQVEIVRHIAKTKLEEKEAANRRREARARRQRILEIINSKKEAELESKSIEELEKMLEDLAI